MRSHSLGSISLHSPGLKRLNQVAEFPGDFLADGLAEFLPHAVDGYIDRPGPAENTIIMLWGDHGWHLGEHNFWGKHNTMHLATRVPLIVSVLGKRAGVYSSLLEAADLFPSLCALAGIATPATVQGRDFTALLDDPNRISTKPPTAVSSMPMPSSPINSATPATTTENPKCSTI